MRVLALIVMALLCGGCMYSADGRKVGTLGDSQQVFAFSGVRSDPQTGWRNVIGPTVVHPAPRGANFLLKHSYAVRSRIDEDAAARGKPFQILVRALFEKRVYLKQAHADGRPLDTVVIDRERTRDGTIETVGIDLTASEMAAAAERGLTFRVTGRRDELFVVIPPAYFAGVLEMHQSRSGTPSLAAVSGSRRKGEKPSARVEASW